MTTLRSNLFFLRTHKETLHAASHCVSRTADTLTIILANVFPKILLAYAEISHLARCWFGEFSYQCGCDCLHAARISIFSST